MPLSELKQKLETEPSFIKKSTLIGDFLREIPAAEKVASLIDIIESRSSADGISPLYVDPINTIPLIRIIKQINLETSQLPEIYSRLYSSDKSDGYRFILGAVSGEEVLKAQNPADFEVFKTLAMSLSDENFQALIDPKNIHSNKFLTEERRVEISQQKAALREGFVEFPATSLRSASATSVVLDGLEAKSGASQFINKTH